MSPWGKTISSCFKELLNWIKITTELFPEASSPMLHPSSSDNETISIAKLWTLASWLSDSYLEPGKLSQPQAQIKTFHASSILFSSQLTSAIKKQFMTRKKRCVNMWDFGIVFRRRKKRVRRKRVIYEFKFSNLLSEDKKKSIARTPSWFSNINFSLRKLLLEKFHNSPSEKVSSTN